MEKIVIFLAIVTLACVNAQRNFAFAGLPTGGVFDMFKNMNLMNPEEMIRQQNIKVMTPEELVNKQPGSKGNFHAQFVKTESLGDGKIHTSVIHNNNGQKTGYTWST